mgnify:CR=1 FL=1
MSKKTLSLYILWIILWFSFWNQGVFWASWESVELLSAPEKPQTIREMSQDLETLKQEKIQLDFKWRTFRIWNEDLGKLIRQTLSEEEKNTLESLIIGYTEDKENYEEDIEIAIEWWEDIEELKRDLILLKQDFYKKLIIYIQIERLQKFKEYVASDLAYREKSNTVSIKIEQKGIARDERVEQNQSKIENNKEILRIQIQDKIISKVEKQLDAFASQEKFLNMENVSKIRIFQSFVDKLELKIQSLETNRYTTSIIEEKIILYEVVKEVFISYMQQWK